MRGISAMIAAAGLAAIAGLMPTSADGAGTHGVVAADGVAWKDGPASIPAGAQAAVLYGDPAEEGLFAMRLKLPAGYRIAPHVHGRPEVVTVISGTFRLGLGEEADWEAAEALTPGGFFFMEPGMAHFVEAAEETVVQLNSVGPWSITYIDAADDPRKSN